MPFVYQDAAHKPNSPAPPPFLPCQFICVWSEDVCVSSSIRTDVHMVWATSWENRFMPFANNKGADQLAHPRSLTSAFVVRSLGSIIPLVSKSEIPSLYLASVAPQVAKSPKTGFLVTRLIWSCRSIQCSYMTVCWILFLASLVKRMSKKYQPMTKYTAFLTLLLKKLIIFNGTNKHSDSTYVTGTWILVANCK